MREAVLEQVRRLPTPLAIALSNFEDFNKKADNDGQDNDDDRNCYWDGVVHCGRGSVTGMWGCAAE